MKTTTFANIGVLALIWMMVSSSPLLAQNTEAFGLKVDIPDDWTFSKDHIDIEHNFGVYQAQSDNSGFFWVQVMNYAEGHANESPLADSSLTEGSVMKPIEFANEIAGFADGFLVENKGVHNYFFVSIHDGKTFRFRIGYNLKEVSFEPEQVQKGQETLRKLVKSIRFTD